MCEGNKNIYYRLRGRGGCLSSLFIETLSPLLLELVCILKPLFDSTLNTLFTLNPIPLTNIQFLGGFTIFFGG